MHQTFYIDIDEEITSIIERLRKSKAREVVIVVPKRALLIQSIINLKLLKKEADEFNKKIIIVTQDKFGKLMVEKTGIAVEYSLEKINGEELAVKEYAKDKIDEIPENFNVELKRNKSSILDTMGSPEFFDSRLPKNQENKGEVDESIKKSIEGERLVNKELITDIGDLIKTNKKKSIISERYDSDGIIKNLDIRQKNAVDFEKDGAGSETYLGNFQKNKGKNLKIKSGFFRKEKLSEAYAEDKEERIKDKRKNENYGYKRDEKIADDYANIKLPKKSKKIFPIAATVLLAIILLSCAYLFLPKAKVTILYAAKNKGIDSEITADIKNEAADFEKNIIPGRIVSVSAEVSKNFDTTGTGGSSSYKARGMITIYNEYSSASQPLVATTRFLSEDGKLFRLISGVVVPGVVKVGAESKPGAIEAEVIADESGDGFNIGPSKFTIPGFQNSGSDKYAKIYAKSFKAMAGGGTGGGSAKSVSQSDIDLAKKQLMVEANAQIKEKAKNETGQDFIILDDAINIGDPIYEISNPAGTIADNFNVNLKVIATVIAFSGSDLNNLVINIFGKNIGQNKKVIENSIINEFGKADADFLNSILKIRVHSDAKIGPVINLEEIRKGILGKSESDLEAYLKQYPDITGIEVRYVPDFISGKIPLYENQVEVVLDNN